MITRLTAHISGNVQRVGYRAKVVSLAKEMGLVGIAQNQSDGRVLVIAESEKKDDLERFASAIKIENALIHVGNMDAKYSQGSGLYSTFRKITGPDEVGERLDEGIEILKEMLTGIKSLTVGVNNLTATTTDGFEKLTAITTDGFDNLDGKMDQMLDKQDATIGEIQALRTDLKGYMDMRFKRIEADLSELKDMKVTLKEKGLI
ncbi:MAG: acylphosphatase [Methanothrix sp.]